MNSRSSLSGGSRSVDREATRLEHPADELVQLRQRLGRRIDELLPDCLPFALPLVSVDSRFEHCPQPARTPHLSNPPPRRLDSAR